MSLQDPVRLPIETKITSGLKNKIAIYDPESPVAESALPGTFSCRSSLRVPAKCCERKPPGIRCNVLEAATESAAQQFMRRPILPRFGKKRIRFFKAFQEPLGGLALLRKSEKDLERRSGPGGQSSGGERPSGQCRRCGHVSIGHHEAGPIRSDHAGSCAIANRNGFQLLPEVITRTRGLTSIYGSKVVYTENDVIYASFFTPVGSERS